MGRGSAWQPHAVTLLTQTGGAGEAGGLGTYWMNEWVGGWATATLDSQGLLSVAGSFLQLASQDVGTLACPR